MVTQPKSPTGRPDAQQWVLLSYRIPREPSTPRIAVWRKLRALGVAQVGDGLVALPSDARTKEQLEWIAASVIEADGDAIVWIATPSGRRNSTELAQQMSEARNAEYRELLDEIEATTALSARTINRWRRTRRAIDRRDYFRAELRDQVRLALQALDPNDHHTTDDADDAETDDAETNSDAEVTT